MRSLQARRRAGLQSRCAYPRACSLAGQSTALRRQGFLSNAERLLGPGWHLTLASRLTVPSHGPLGFAVVTAPDIRSSLDVLLRFMSTRAPFLWSAGTAEGDQFVLRFHEAVE